MIHPMSMSDEQSDDFESRLKTLDIVVKLGWALLAGAFALGVWVAAIQIAVNENTSGAAAMQPRIRALELNEATNAERLKNILNTVERIERKVTKE